MSTFLNPIGAALGGVGGLISGFAGTKTTSSTNQTTSSNATTSGSSSTTPNMSTLQQMLSNLFGAGAMNNYNENVNLQPYINSGLQNINSGTSAASQQIAAQLASRGLSSSPYAATAEMQPQLQAQQEQSQLLNSIPLLQQQLNLQNLSGVESAFTPLPTGTTSAGTGTSTSSGTNNSQTTQGTPGSWLQGLAGLFTGGAMGSSLKLTL
jgi:hypothetical protein